jgi:dCTP diphosphatase
MSESLDLNEVASFLRGFAAERDWDQFHTPKNLSMALAGEAGELLEIFQWLTPEQSSDLDDTIRQHAGEELVDILQYVVRIADLLDVDLNEAFWTKFEKNSKRYPADEVKGSAEKR